MSTIKKYAPLLLYHKSENHFLGNPKEFWENARFRQSNFRGRDDRGWNKTHGKWEENNNDGPDYRGVDWEVIKKQISEATAERRPGGPTRDGKVTRPRDDRNVWSNEDKARGFFLDLKGGFGKGGSARDLDDPSPIFHDVHKFTVDGRRYIAVLYWFFYMQNWYIIYTHEGDWEHMTLYFREKDFEEGKNPIWIYFASHDNGHFFRWTDRKIKYEDHTHLHVYVSRFGHPSSPTVPRPKRKDYIYKIKTWDQDIPSIQDFDWDTYCGAWGEVGEKAMTTGPLGPFFKRNSDIQKIVRRIVNE